MTSSSTGTKAGVLTSSASYDDRGQLAELHYYPSGATFFRQQLYRDALGRIIRIGETVDGQTHAKVYRYDTAGRLDSVAVDSAIVARYRYDGNNPGNGNRTLVIGPTSIDTASATYDAQDRMLRYGAVAYSYTANGDLKKIKHSSTDSTQFTYDALSNLIRVKTPDGHQLDYLTDGLNRRVGYKVDGILQRLWLYRNGLNPVAELDRQGSLVTRYVYGTEGHVPDLLLQASHGYRVVTDYLGSVRAVVDTADGTAAQRIDYDAWGVRTVDTAPDFQALGYAGGLSDSATGLVRFGARDYEPHTGRFVSKDPIGFAGGDANLYAYVLNHPINLIDPMGTDWLETTASFSAGLGDALLLGFGDEIRKFTDEQFGWRGGALVNECSTAYSAGGWTSFAFGVGRVGYAAAAKGVSIAASSGAAASAARQQLKNAFRLGMGKSWRLPNLAGISDAALRASAGRTNPVVNAYGAGVAAAGAAGGTGCGCP